MLPINKKEEREIDHIVAWERRAYWRW